MPDVETAIVNGPRLTTDGTIKLQSKGMSTTFTRYGASSEIFLFVSLESVAAMTRNAFLRSPFFVFAGDIFYVSSQILFLSLSVHSGLITVTFAPDLSSGSAFLSAYLAPADNYDFLAFKIQQYWIVNRRDA